jgi:CheY-like chemotaxis protein
MKRPPLAERQAGRRWPPERLRHVRVLLVDDDQDERETLAILLGAAGADVRCAESAAEALATLVAWWPDVLVTDIAMPGADGFALLRAVRGMPGGARLPVAAVTGQAAREDRRRALDAGFRAHVAKPVDPERLLVVVADLAAPTPSSHPAPSL